MTEQNENTIIAEAQNGAETAGAAVRVNAGGDKETVSAVSAADHTAEDARIFDGHEASGKGGTDGEIRTDETARKAAYTADEVRALLQSEGDRRVSGALKKWEREEKERVSEAAQILAQSMTEELRAEADGLRRALDEAKAQSRMRERELALLSALGERGLPSELLGLLIPAKSGTEEAALDTVCRVISDCAKREVEKRLRSSAPHASRAKQLPTSDELRTLPVAKLAELMR